MNITLRIDEGIVKRVYKIAMKRFFTFQNILIVLLVSLGVISLGVVFSDGECVLQLVGLREKNESLTFKGCISQLLGSSEDNKRKTLTFLGIGMGGILVALQALMSYRRAKALEDTVRNTGKGQRQERLKNAIEHLGHESVSVRLGGAYELFHLARDTEDAHDSEDRRETVLDILCAHIRQTTGESEYRKTYKSKPSEEIQSLLTLLFVQDHKVFSGLHINLQGSWLNGAVLQAARLEKANLSGMSIQRADLREARLQGAVLKEAVLRGAYLSEATLQGTDLREARLQGAFLTETQLQGADLRRIELQGAVLTGAQLQGADLTGAQLQGVTSGVSQREPLPSRRENRVIKRFIRAQIGRETDLTGAIFAGGMSQKDLDFLNASGFSDEEAKKLRAKLEPHIDKQKNNQLPEDSGAVTGTYSKEYAEELIAEYNEAPKDIED